MKYLILLFLALWTLGSFAQQQQQLITFQELSINSTIKIENHRKDGNVVYGTGFFFTYVVDGNRMPVMITNKHVSAMSDYCVFTIKGVDAQGAVSIKRIRMTGEWIEHPTLDLSCYSYGTELTKLFGQYGLKPINVTFFTESIPSPQEINNLYPAQDVYMIGYPAGLEDMYNNLPLMRKGITSTPYRLKFNNGAMFPVDIPAFPGSSGSPVVTFLADKVLLLGVMTESKTFNNTTFLNIGMAIKSYHIIEMIQAGLSKYPVTIDKAP